MCAGGLVECMFPGDIGVVNTSLSGGTTIAQGVFIEMFMTAELVFVVLMLAAEKSKSTFMAPIGIGLALFVAMMGGMSSCLAREELIFQFMKLIINRGLLYGRFT
jgi:aquaporin related protein